MKNQFSDKSFVFGDAIDATFLYSLYENDLPYIEQVFKATLIELDTTERLLLPAAEQRDAAALKRTVHKVKPLFGFAGLPKFQEILQQFEDACPENAAKEFPEVKFNKAFEAIQTGKRIIEHEYAKLKDFNGTNEYV